MSKPFKDKDGYWKVKLPDGSLAVQNLDKNGKPINKSYIGGNTNQARDKYWEQSPIMKHATDSIANAYGITPNSLRNRLNHEGFTDKSIRANNSGENVSDYNYLNKKYAFKGKQGVGEFGLDDAHTYIQSGKANLINESYYDADFINEKGRKTKSANGITVKDNIGIMASLLQMFRTQAAKDFPKSSNKFLDEASNVYYNRGFVGGKTYMKRKK